MSTLRHQQPILHTSNPLFKGNLLRHMSLPTLGVQTPQGEVHENAEIVTSHPTHLNFSQSATKRSMSLLGRVPQCTAHRFHERVETPKPHLTHLKSSLETNTTREQCRSSVACPKNPRREMMSASRSNNASYTPRLFPPKHKHLKKMPLSDAYQNRTPIMTMSASRRQQLTLPSSSPLKANPRTQNVVPRLLVQKIHFEADHGNEEIAPPHLALQILSKYDIPRPDVAPRPVSKITTTTHHEHASSAPQDMHTKSTSSKAKSLLHSPRHLKHDHLTNLAKPPTCSLFENERRNA